MSGPLQYQVEGIFVVPGSSGGSSVLQIRLRTDRRYLQIHLIGRVNFTVSSDFGGSYKPGARRGLIRRVLGTADSRQFANIVPKVHYPTATALWGQGTGVALPSLTTGAAAKTITYTLHIPLCLPRDTAMGTGLDGPDFRTVTVEIVPGTLDDILTVTGGSVTFDGAEIELVTVSQPIGALDEGAERGCMLVYRTETRPVGSSFASLSFESANRIVACMIQPQDAAGDPVADSLEIFQFLLNNSLIANISGRSLQFIAMQQTGWAWDTDLLPTVLGNGLYLVPFSLGNPRNLLSVGPSGFTMNLGFLDTVAITSVTVEIVECMDGKV
ncbi:MAG: hypothetical protein HY719_01300 [Planctomycetes bacterium]|nr:hypothetical protein [Planctomycetota bacterium]